MSDLTPFLQICIGIFLLAIPSCALLWVILVYRASLLAAVRAIGGANWRTSLTGIGGEIALVLTILSGLSYQLGPLAEIIPPKVKAAALTVSLVSTFLLKSLNSVLQKDRNVTGGGIQQTATGEVAPIQSPTPTPPAPAIPPAQ